MSVPIGPYDRNEVVARALNGTTNVPNTCQLWTRTICGAPSAGDYDGDGASDAEDGWKMEPSKYKHPGDRNPPAGVPVAYIGGSNDNGHRAISLGNGMIRSTDAGGWGHISTVPLNWPELNWGLKYVGWSDTCDGILIPTPPPPPVPKTRGKRVDAAVKNLRHAKGKGKRAAAIKAALRALLGITPKEKKR